eukprot:SAG31_NODE_5553_length_2461_cov_1.270957_2_plen_137_part_00
MNLDNLRASDLKVLSREQLGAKVDAAQLGNLILDLVHSSIQDLVKSSSDSPQRQQEKDRQERERLSRQSLAKSRKSHTMHKEEELRLEATSRSKSDDPSKFFSKFTGGYEGSFAKIEAFYGACSPSKLYCAEIDRY